MQYFRITPLNSRDELLLYVHLLTQLCVASSHRQSLEDMLHVSITIIETVINVQHLAVLAFLVALVEDAQHLVQTALTTLATVCLTCKQATQEGYLYNDAIVCQTVNKRVG